MSRDGSLKSSSKNSRDALVLNEASSCWAEVPAEVKDKKLTADISYHFFLKVTKFLRRNNDYFKKLIFHSPTFLYF